MAGQRFNLPPVSMIMLGVRDLEKSVSFYRDRLGIDIRQRIPGFAFLASGALTIVLSEPLAKNVSPLVGATEVIFSVNDVRASYEALKDQGVEFRSRAMSPARCGRQISAIPMDICLRCSARRGSHRRLQRVESALSIYIWPIGVCADRQEPSGAKC